MKHLWNLSKGGEQVIRILNIAFRVLWGVCCLYVLVVGVALLCATYFFLFTETADCTPTDCSNALKLGWVWILWSMLGLVAAVYVRVKYSGIVLWVHFVLTVIGMLVS